MIHLVEGGSETLTAVPFNRVLRMGARGLDVAAVHVGLRRSGHTVRLGRSYTRNVRDRIKEFQHANGLHADGVYGRETHKHLSTHFNAYARRIYRRASRHTSVTGLSRRQAALRLEHYHSEGRLVGRVEDISDIRRTADGLKVRNSSGEYVYLNTHMLQALCFLVEKYRRIGTIAICSDHHYDGPHGHWGGHAVDISQVGNTLIAATNSRAATLALARTLHSGMPSGIVIRQPSQLICDGYGGYHHDAEISALCIPGPWFYAFPPTTLPAHRNHIHFGYYA